MDNVTLTRQVLEVRNSRVEGAGEKWQVAGMNAAVVPSPESIRAYCLAHSIFRLRLFGSATRGDFDALRSDVDLLVEYEPGRHPGLDHFRIAEELSELFGRKVDLNTPAMLGRHLEKVLPEARLLYGEA
jgi:predicted nucleotidyltransferase